VHTESGRKGDRDEAVPAWQRVPIMSGHTIRWLLDAGEGDLEVSLDLGRSRTSVTVRAGQILLGAGLQVPQGNLAAAFSAPEDCVLIYGERCEKTYRYSDRTRRYYKLFQPHEDRAPTIVINNATMHAVVGKDPWQNASEKVATVPVLDGPCLDTCCGLGYSAQLLAARGSGPVTTCESDVNVLHMAAVNPWSEGLFSHPQVTVRLGGLQKLLAGCGPEQFAIVFHDPPTVHQAGDLYSGQIYRELARVLMPGGAMYHYVGAPGGRLGRDHAGGVMRRMQEGGFERVRRVTDGVLGFRRAGAS